MKNLTTRLISGIIYVAIIIGAVIMGGWWMEGLIVLLLFGAVTEVFNLLSPLRGAEPARLAARTLDYLTALSFVFLYGPLGVMTFTEMAVLLMFYMSVRVVMALADRGGDALETFRTSLLAVLYPSLGLTALGVMYYSFGDMGRMTVLAMFILIWLNDTGAYCVGSTLGRHRLCERLSPKKSWEGFWGGFAFCVLAGAGFSFIGAFGFFSLWQWILVGAWISVWATWGDLFESLIKRSVGAKDAGHIIPGHGGVLDRIDSLLLVAPTLLALMMIL